MHLRILADDLTGALDSAAAFAGRAQVPVWLGKTPSAADAKAAVQALSTGTRDHPPHEAEQIVCGQLAWFARRDAGALTAFKKIDSLLRGNTFCEVAALAASGAFSGVVFAPAFPAQGRFTRDGRHWVGPAHRPDAAAVQTCFESLVNAFAEHGLTAVTGPVTQPAPTGSGQVWIPDVLTDADLHALVANRHRPAAAGWLWCGSAGLAEALAHQWQGLADSSNNTDDELPAPPALAVTASRHPVLREQMLRLPRPWHHDHAGAGSDAQLVDLAPTHDLSPAQAAAHLASACRELVRRRSPPGTAVVIGGDTLLALCMASGASHLMACSSIRPGWGRARIAGGLWHGTTLLSRSGAFGAPDDIAALLAQLAPHTSNESIT